MAVTALSIIFNNANLEVTIHTLSLFLIVLGWFPCVQVTFKMHMVAVRLSVLCIKVGVGIELTFRKTVDS